MVDKKQDAEEIDPKDVVIPATPEQQKIIDAAKVEEAKRNEGIRKKTIAAQVKLLEQGYVSLGIRVHQKDNPEDADVIVFEEGEAEKVSAFVLGLLKARK